MEVYKQIEENKDERERKKYLIKYLKEKFGIKYFRKEDFEKLYLMIIENKDNFKEEDFLDFDIIDFKKEILRLQRNSKKFDEFHEEKILKIKEEIKNEVGIYLKNDLSDNELKNIIDEIKGYTGEINDIEELKISQIVLQTMGEEHKLLTFIIEVNGKKVNIDILKNKNGEIERVYPTKDLFGNEKGGFKPSEIITKKYDNPDAGVELNPEYGVDKNKFNLENEEVNNKNGKQKKVNFSDNLREKVKENKKDEELNIFIQLTKEWNKIFKRNKEELAQAKTEEKKQQIIDRNAQAIADLFADNATLQGTMDFDNSYGVDGIKAYFIHFLEKSPTMRFSKINEINKYEDGLLNVQGDYDFEVDNGEGGRETKDANFDFYFERNEETGKWGIKRLNSTFGKTEDNLKDTENKDS